MDKQIGLVAATAVASLILNWGVRALALRLQVLDIPNARSSHTKPTPRGGGIGFIVAAALGLAFGAMRGMMDTHVAVALGCGMLALGVVGWIDDRRGVSARARLAVHLAVAGGTVYLLGGLPTLRIGETALTLHTAGAVFATVGIVWSINLFNFMDGIDGLAGSQALLIFGAFAALLFLTGDPSLATMAAVFAAASGGFLAWNWPPAKIFLGDVGSGPIGYLVASLALASENAGSVPLLAFAIGGGVFISDATVTLFRRLIRRKRVMEAHRDHAYQRLARAWGAHLPVTLAAGGVTCLLLGLAVAGTTYARFLLPALGIAISVVAGLLFAAEKTSPLDPSGSGSPTQA